ncbi:MAG TPA: BrnA antitoxin family protein [Granulicella sp.]|jgi:uncharacterized protein (DUF4415 family)|nr:BrnA antitoxin family protein [Granulicella sp.]
MANRKPLTTAAGEVRELTKKDFAGFVPFSALPENERAVLSSRKRGAQLVPKKVPVSIRLSPDVVEGLRATGEGWQTRADEALRLWLATGTTKGKKTAAR